MRVLGYCRGAFQVLREMSQRPHTVQRWLSDRLTTATPIQAALPWISWSCIHFLREQIRPGLRVFEWGGGGSTIFFASAGCYVTTVESNRDWFKRITKRLELFEGEPRPRVDLRLVEGAEDQPDCLRSYIGQVHDGGPWDLVLVDGVGPRIRCIEEAQRELKSGGLLIVDNAGRLDLSSVSAILAGEFKRLEFPGFGPCRIRPTKTDIYVSQR